MGLHSRLFRSFRYITGNPINPFSHSRLHHHNNSMSNSPSPNPNPKFLLKRLYGNTDEDGGDYYFSLLSANGQHISIEKNLYFRSPRAPPPCPFGIIGNSRLSELQPPYWTSLISSCDGLVCLQDYHTEGTVVLWNPLTDEFKVLRDTSIKSPRSTAYTTFRCAGFGIDAQSKEYKVVRCVDNVFEDKDYDGNDIYGGTETRFEVFSLKTGSWWPLRNPEVYPSISSSPSIYARGVYYWPATHATGPDFILSFNFANEKFSFLRLPETGKPIGPYTFRLVEYEGLLGFVLFPLLGTEKTFELWVREKEWWTKVTSFVVAGAEKPLAYWSKDKWFFEGISRELLLFDLTTEELEHLNIYDFPQTMELIPFVESTISPNAKNNEEEESETPAQLPVWMEKIRDWRVFSHAFQMPMR